MKPVTNQSRPLKKPLDVVGKLRDRRVCGHEDDFKILKGEKPEYMQRRKEKWKLKRCSNCVAAAEKQRKEEAAKLRAIREKKYRLPHNSIFQVTYDASIEKWRGTLTTSDGVFEADCEGIHGLLRGLGRKWQALVAQKSDQVGKEV
jgi:hypothetical protein